MLRSINKQQIFFDNEDYEKFVNILCECKAISEYQIYAYCLMGNHIHLLIKPVKESLETVFKRISGRFVYWYNTKYQRTGHLFQDRFKSEAVEDDAYLLTVVRYIHQNPVKAGVCKNCDDYKYSSYKAYYGQSDFVDVELIESLMSESQYKEFHNLLGTEVCLELDDNKPVKVTDEEAMRILYKISNCRNVTEFSKIGIALQEKYIIKMYSKGLSLRQICRLTGVSMYLVRKYTRT